MRDLEIRGAGNLLGREQHGNIAGVGFVMYVQMLEEAVNRLRNEGYTKTVDVRTTLEVRVDAFIDDTYIEHGGQKNRNVSTFGIGTYGRSAGGIEE